MRPLMNYYGGKWNMAPWIIEHFPEHDIYVEAFGGSAGVLLRKPRSKREIINDMDDEIFNLYDVVRRKGEDLQRLLTLTPHSRKEYYLAHEKSKEDLERARRTIVKSFFGIGDSVFRNSGFRASKDSNVSVANTWQSYHYSFKELLERFKGVTIECLDYLELISKYDSPRTLFYLDPPYLKSTRCASAGYRHDWGLSDHVKMIESIQGLKGMVIVSGYDGPVYDKLNFKKVQRETLIQGNKTRTETLYLCPKTSSSQTQLELMA